MIARHGTAWQTWCYDTWQRRRTAKLIRRIDEVDPLVCPRCQSRMRIIAFITEPKVIRKILLHLAAKRIDARSPPGPRERHPIAA